MADARTAQVELYANELSDTARELKLNAWMYKDKDTHTYDALNKAIKESSIQYDLSQLSSNVRPNLTPSQIDSLNYPSYDASTNYNKPYAVKLKNDGEVGDFIREQVKECGGWISTVDEWIEKITHISPLNIVLKPLDGNWTVFGNVAYLQHNLGEALEDCGKNVVFANKNIADGWSGQAYENFSTFSKRLEEVFEWQKSLGKFIKEAFIEFKHKAAEMIEHLVTKLKDQLEEKVKVKSAWQAFKLVVKAAAEFVPGADIALNAAEALDITNKARKLAEEAVELFNKIKDALRNFGDLLKGFIDVINSMTKGSSGKGIVDKIKDGKKFIDEIKDAKKEITKATKDEITDYAKHTLGDKAGKATKVLLDTGFDENGKPKAILTSFTGTLAGLNSLKNAPKAGYFSGGGSNPWADYNKNNSTDNNGNRQQYGYEAKETYAYEPKK